MEQIIYHSLEDFKSTEIYDGIVINLKFARNDIYDKRPIDTESRYFKDILEKIKLLEHNLKRGGLLFIYGPPKFLPSIAVSLNNSKYGDDYLLFKYWIALEFFKLEKNDLPKTHLGMLMYLKTRSIKYTTPFNINFKEVRVPHSYCPSCEKNVKDWGGKKHRMNPLGTAMSDVWTDLKPETDDITKIPQDYIDRVFQLIDEGDSTLLVLEQEQKSTLDYITTEYKAKEEDEISIPINQVIEGDSLDLMENWVESNQGGLFDLAFADPPYNLSKEYNEFDDFMKEQKYIEWSLSWLQKMIDVLKPGGDLFVLNIPKWAVYYADFLVSRMNYENWIVWDAMSVPGGKLLPAHYSLLHFKKPGGEEIQYERHEIDHKKYCLRNKCIRERKKNEDDDKEEITDIWWDIHRLKHKKDRDNHPCQLPVDLLNRIITLFSEENDIVYDPFGGAGTTAISAKLKNRNYVITEVDPKYVKISQNNLDKIVEKKNTKQYIRKSVLQEQKKNGSIPRNQIEKRYFSLCQNHDEVLSIDTVKLLDNELYNWLDQYYDQKFSKLKNMAKRKKEVRKKNNS